jgi:glutamine amidotransferase
MIAVIDYGMGNLRSVEKALQAVGARTKVTSRAADLKRAQKIVLPGVGAFGAAMKELKRLRLAGPIKDAISAEKPFLGLCLGLQLLFERSEESPGVKGLGILNGEVRHFAFKRRSALKVPHMGWNCIVRRDRRPETGDRRVLEGVEDGSYMYFVHSYYAAPEDKGIVLTTTDYGIEFASAVCRGNIIGLQFHPEKSQRLGLKILKNFVRLKTAD